MSPERQLARIPSPPSRAPGPARPAPELAPWGNAALQDDLGVCPAHEPPVIEDATPAQAEAVHRALDGARRLAREARVALDGSLVGRERSRFEAAFGPLDPERRQRVRDVLAEVERGLAEAVPIDVDAWSPVTWLPGRENTLAFVVRLDRSRADIHLLPGFFALGDDEQAWAILHEALHKYVGLRDIAYSWEPSFATLAPGQAVENPDSYAAYAASRVRDLERDAEFLERSHVVDHGALLWEDYQQGRLVLWEHDVRLPDGRVVDSETAGLGLVDWLIVHRPDVVEALEGSTDFGEPLLLPDGTTVGHELYMAVREVKEEWEW